MTRLLGLLAVLLVAGPASAQEPDDDEPVKPAQFTEPIPAPNGQPVPQRGLPPMPPTPVVQVMVLAPKDAQGAKDVEYTVRVVNNSAVPANLVQVRVQWPDGAAEVTKTEPPTAVAPNKDVIWKLGTMEPGGSQTLTFAVKPAAGAGEIAVRAYVRFEHGQRVVTKLSAPKLLLKADAPKQVTADAPVPVRLTVTNNGRVPATDTKLTVTISDGFEFAKEDGGDPTKQPNQRVWEIGTLPPGNVRPLTIRVRPKDGRELTVSAGVNSSNTAADQAKTETKVVETGLKLTVDGDPKAGGGTAAKYVATVKNTGGTKLTGVRVTAFVPDDCRPTRKTDNDGRWSPARIDWTIPVALDPGETFDLRWNLECTGSGKRTVKVVATAGGLEDKGSVDTVFAGAPQLSWEQRFDQATVGAGKPAMLTVKVSNTGNEPAANVRLAVDLPAEVLGLDTTPKGVQKDGRRWTFPAEMIPPGKTREFSLSFRGESPGPAYFEMQLAADAYAQPLTAKKSVEVTGGR